MGIISSNKEIHVGDVGTFINVYLVDDGVAVDIAGNTAITYTFKRPDQTTFTRTGSQIGDSALGHVRYVLINGDIDQHGRWSLQVTVTLPSGTFNSEVSDFMVFKNL